VLIFQADSNQIARVDFLQARYLTMLAMERKMVKNLHLENNYPRLKWLDVSRNLIDVLDVNKLKSSRLEHLVLGTNDKVS